jgi:hypothetical protein
MKFNPAQRLILLGLALAGLVWWAGRKPSQPPLLPKTPPAETPTTDPTATATLTPFPTPVATPTPALLPIAKGVTDAFAMEYFPWVQLGAAASTYVGEGKVRVVNSLFLDEPPFFGFDIHPREQWYHVVGLEQWAATDVGLISPTFHPYRQPHDTDFIVVHGQIEGMYIVASYVGFTDGTPYFYRSLLRAEELRPEIVPKVYDGLDVWVRGTLDVPEGQGHFYVLPAGTRLETRYVGQEALVGGRLQVGESIRVQVTRGIFVQESGRYVRILEDTPSPATRDVYERGWIVAVDRAGLALHIKMPNGRTIQVNLGAETRIKFADGSQTEASELFTGREVEVLGRPASGEILSANKVSITRQMAQGTMYAAYIAGPNRDLWRVGLDGQGQQQQITRLPAPELAAGLQQTEFSPDGAHFVFARREGEQSTLVLGDLSSGELHDLLADDEWQESDPVWSPEGSRIAFCRYRLEGEQRLDGGLWLLVLKDGSSRRLTGPADEGWQTVVPRWSPDGKHLAFGQTTTSGQSLSTAYVVSPPASSALVLEHAWEWRWWTDSAQLLCTRQAADEDRARLWVVQRDGTSATWITPTSGVHDTQGRWSPDGTAIVFLSRPASSHDGDRLWVMQQNGLDRRQLTPDDTFATRPFWSADSQAIIFLRVTAAGDSQGLWMVGRDGTGLRQLAADASAVIGTYQGE